MIQLGPILSLAGLLGCPSPEGSMEDSCRPLRADSTAPSVIATAPEDGSTGVRTSTSVTFEFDEPMDPDSTVASVTSNATLTGVLLSADGTVLTVEAELQYGLPNTPPRSYTVTVGADATDRAGNELGAPVELSFSTAVRHELVIVPAFNDRHLRDGVGGTWLGAGDGDDDDDEIQGQACRSPGASPRANPRIVGGVR